MLLESYFRHIYRVSWFYRTRKNCYFSRTSKAESGNKYKHQKSYHGQILYNSASYGTTRLLYATMAEYKANTVSCPTMLTVQNSTAPQRRPNRMPPHSTCNSFHLSADDACTGSQHLILSEVLRLQERATIPILQTKKTVCIWSQKPDTQAASCIKAILRTPSLLPPNPSSTQVPVLFSSPSFYA